MGVRNHVAVIGGDERQVHLAKLLARDGWQVSTWGLPGGEKTTLSQAASAELILLPLPVLRGGELNLPLSEEKISPERLWARLGYDQLLLGGMAGDLPERLMADYGLTLVDYYQREELQIANAVPTAEGAVQKAMEATDGTLQKSRCLVLGFGRVGKVLAHRLYGLGAYVTVAARKYADLAWADAYGYEALPMDRLNDELGRFDLLFNTAPALLLDASRLALTDPDCLIVDLASRPGGVDREAAAGLGRRVLTLPGLPGQVAPRAAAEAIREAIYHILEERGEPI
jgi:dipicolinate synthase subunit A